MYNNPFFNGFREQQPITQNFQLTNPFQGNDIFMARFLKDNESVDNILITNKTAFIDLKNKQLVIKELDGNKSIYEIVLPRDEKDIEIDTLKKEIQELKEMFSNESNANVPTNDEITESNGNGKKSNRK